MNFLSALLGRKDPREMQGGQMPPMQGMDMPQGAPGEEEPITVQDEKIDIDPGKGKGFFAVGNTGGNILGTIGDALLIGGGKDAIYHPKLQQAKEAIALEGFGTSPEATERALKEYGTLDGKGAVGLRNEYGELQSKEALQAAQARKARDDYDNITHDRALAYLGAATDKTYGQIKPLIEKWYADRGSSPLFQLPDTYDADAIGALAAGGMTQKERASLAEQRRYHEETADIQRGAEYGRNYRMGYQEFEEDRRDKRQEAGRDRRTNTVETGKNNRATASPGAAGGRPANGPRVVRDANGKVRIVR